MEHTKKKRVRKSLISIMGGVLALCLLLAPMFANVYAEETDAHTPESDVSKYVTNVEDLINGYDSDIKLEQNSADDSVQVLYEKYDTTKQNVKISNSPKKSSGEVDSNKSGWVSVFTKSEDELSTLYDEDLTSGSLGNQYWKMFNRNEYSGNYTINVLNISDSYPMGFWFNHNEETAKKDIQLLSFRSVYFGHKDATIDLTVNRTGLAYNGAPQYGGYMFTLYQSADKFLAIQASGTNLANTQTIVTVSESDVLNYVNEHNSKSYTALAGNRTNGTAAIHSNSAWSVKPDELLYTYGTYGETDEGIFIYFRLDNATTGETLYELNQWSEIKADKTGYICAVRTHLHRHYFNFSGVNEPLIVTERLDSNNNETSDITLTGTFNEDDLISGLTLPTGYALKSTAGTLKGGVNELAATYTRSYEYYGNKTKTYDCTITVNATAKPKYNVTVKDLSGATVATYSVKQGENYTFATIEGREKSFIAYKDSQGKLYNVGDSVTLSADAEYTLVEAKIDIDSKVSVRLFNNENGYGGLRYMATISKTDYDTIKDLGVKLYGAIIATDLVDGTFDYNEAGVKTTEITQDAIVEDGSNALGYFTMTDIMLYNFNREFSGMAYLEVTYEDSDKAYVQTDSVAASIYDLAVEAYAAHNQAKTENSVGLYSSDNVKMLEYYIKSVIDLTYSDGSISVTEETGTGLSADYTATATIDENVATVTINVENSSLKNLISENELPVSVILRNGSGAELNAYQSVIITSRSLSGNTLTITFSLPNA